MRCRNTTTGLRRLSASVLLLGCSWNLAFAASDYAAAYSAYQQQSFSQAEKTWSELAAAGDANAQYALAVMHLKSETTVPDPVAAFQLLQEAAQQNHTTAMFNLGIAFWEGVGTEVDRQQAMDWWHQAAESGEAGAQYNLGLIYYIGEQQPQDLAQAKQWLSSAAAAKHPEAEKLLYLIMQKIEPKTQSRDESAEMTFSTPAPPLIMERAPLVVEPEVQSAVIDEDQIVEQDDARPAQPEGAQSGTAGSEQQLLSTIEPEPTQSYWHTASMTTLHPTADLREPGLAQLPANIPVEILDQRDLASKVAIPGGVQLWVYGRFVAVDGSRGTISASAVNARPLPTTDNSTSPPVGQFRINDSVTIMATEGEWIKVRAPAHLGAWIDNSKLSQYADTSAGRTSAWESAASQGF